MSSSVSEGLVQRGKLLVHIAENGHSFNLDCDEYTLVEEVQRFLESVSGIHLNDQLLLCFDMKLESLRQLSAYKLPSSDREVYLFNRARMRSNSPIPSPEQVEIIETSDPLPPSSSNNPHPLDDASDPALKSLPSYERQFRYHYQHGHAIYSCTLLKYETCERLLREQKVQERALEIARVNLEHFYKMILQNYTDFVKHYSLQHRIWLLFRTMEGKPTPIFLFSFIFSLLLSHSSPSLSKPLQYQYLLPRSLPTPQSLTWTEDSQTLTLPDDEDTLSLQLHHLDSLSFNNANSTPDALFTLRLRRDAVRAKTLSAIAAVKTNSSAAFAGRKGGKSATDFSSSIISGLEHGSGEYFTRLGIGTPPKYSYMVVDTGSDVVWIQCSPCRKCYSQSDPVFDPTKSTSFVGVTCGSPLCQRLDTPGCNQLKKCMYQVSYGDGSFTVGEFSTETMTFRNTRVDNVALGCGHDNEGLFVGAAGLLGLGRGKLSFPSQAGPRFGRKFSYCLVDRSASSKASSIVFGGSAVSRTAVFTPLLTNPKIDTFYYIGLIGISVGGVRVRGITASLFKMDPAGNGGVIIDSGTSVTRLTRPAYVALRDAFRAGASNLKPAADFSLFDTCFDLSGKTEVKVPTVVLHFTGADVSLPATNYLIPVDSSGTFCFAFAGTGGGLSIVGNIQQQGFRVVYDLAGSRVGFAPRGCA